MLWIIFAIYVAATLLIGRVLFPQTEQMNFKAAWKASFYYVIAAVLFIAVIWVYHTHYFTSDIALHKSLEFLSGYLIEESLSVDNLFVFFMIFHFFKISEKDQQKILFYGILGAIVMRLIMITGGIWLVNQFDWIWYLFGAILFFSAIKIITSSEDDDFADSKTYKFLIKILPISSEPAKSKFIIYRNKKIQFTSLFLTLVCVEITDLIFAMDSIPAIFAVTNDVFIVFSSNIFAIMALRAMYFLLVATAKKFKFLKYGIAVLLILLSIKMVFKSYFHMGPLWTLAAIVSILTITILADLFFRDKKRV